MSDVRRLMSEGRFLPQEQIDKMLDQELAVWYNDNAHVKGTGTWHVGATEGWYQYLSKRQYCYQPLILSCDATTLEILIRNFCFFVWKFRDYFIYLPPESVEQLYLLI